MEMELHLFNKRFNNENNNKRLSGGKREKIVLKMFESTVTNKAWTKQAPTCPSFS